MSVLFCAPLFAVPDGLGIQDWDQHLFYHGAVLKSVVEYGQWPFWNPWYCGGNVLWQNPQVPLLSPAYLMTAAVPLPLAMKLNIVVHYWVGFVGMHLLLTRVVAVVSLPIVVYLASVFTLSGAPALHLAVGHSNFLPAFYLPMLLYFVCRAVRTGAVRTVVAAGAVLALVVVNGGSHMLPLAVTGIGLFSVFAALFRREWRPLLVAVLLGAGGLAYAAPKLLPVALFATSDEFWDARTVTGHPDVTTPEMMLRSYADPYQYRNLRFDLQRHGWHEYGNYVGSPALLLTLASIAWILWDRRLACRWLGLSLAATTLVLVAWSAGEFSRFAPASLTAGLPLFSSFRIPSRFTVAVVLFASATIGWALASVGAGGARSGPSRALVTICCVLATLDLAVRNRSQLEGVFGQPPLAAGFRWMGGPDRLEVDAESTAYGPGSPMFRALMSDRSFFRCYEGVRLKATAEVEHPLVAGAGDARIFTTSFSPNRVEASVVVGREPARLLLNQNFDAGWSTTIGSAMADPSSGKPSVVLPAGYAGRLEFVYAPRGIWLGAGIFVLVSALSLFLWRRQIISPDDPARWPAGGPAAD